MSPTGWNMSETRSGVKNGVPQIRRRRALENGVWSADLCHITEVDDDVEDYLVLTPKGIGADRIGGVAILPERAGRLGLQRVYRIALETSMCEVPRGFVDEGETAEQAASRELEEETGLRCPPERLERLATIAPEPSTIAAYVAIFLAPNCRGELRQGDEVGVGAMEFYDPEELEAALENGTVVDATTMIAARCYLCRSLRESEKDG